MTILDNSDYNAWLTSLKERIRTAQTRAVVAVNTELVTLYWQIAIVARSRRWARRRLGRNGKHEKL
jgi:hypothetical protein